MSSLLYQSKEVGPVPCHSTNLIIDFQICLQNPLDRSITAIPGLKDSLFCDEWQNNITMELGERWNSLLPAVQIKWKICKYLTFFCILLCIGIPLILYYFYYDKKRLWDFILITGPSCICCLIIAFICFYFWFYGVSKQFRKQFVTKLLVQYIEKELAVRYRQFNFTILYPVVFYLSPSTNAEPVEVTYCVLRVSDGVVYSEHERLEPIFFTTSERMKKIHSKYQKRKNQKNSHELGSGVSFTPRSDTNPPILHQMRTDNNTQYSNLGPSPNKRAPLISSQFGFKSSGSEIMQSKSFSSRNFNILTVQNSSQIRPYNYNPLEDGDEYNLDQDDSKTSPK